jgi:hypothetical protein
MVVFALGWAILWSSGSPYTGVENTSLVATAPQSQGGDWLRARGDSPRTFDLSTPTTVCEWLP